MEEILYRDEFLGAGFNEDAYTDYPDDAAEDETGGSLGANVDAPQAPIASGAVADESEASAGQAVRTDTNIIAASMDLQQSLQDAKQKIADDPMLLQKWVKDERVTRLLDMAQDHADRDATNEFTKTLDELNTVLNEVD